MRVESISASTWDQYVHQSSQENFFHLSQWPQVTTAICGGVFHPVIVWVREDVPVLVPVLTGQPWSSDGWRMGGIGYGGPIYPAAMTDMVSVTENPHQQLRDMIKIVAKNMGLPCTGITSDPALYWQHQECRTTQIIDLDRSAEALFDQVLTGNVRTAIRKANAANIQVIRADSEDVREHAYALLRTTQLAVGSAYVTDRRLFDYLCDLDTGLARAETLCAVLDDRIIGVATFLYARDEAFHLLHGCDRQATGTCANQLLLWHGIQHACRAGAARFNFGESHYDSLRVAKARWGAYAVPLLRLTGPALTEFMSCP